MEHSINLNITSFFYSTIVCINVLYKFSTSITMYSSTLGNLILVIDQLLFTWYLEQYPDIVTKTKKISVITAKWVYVIAISAPYLLFKHEHQISK